jgi:hypothetical protein
MPNQVAFEVQGSPYFKLNKKLQIHPIYNAQENLPHKTRLN